MVALKISIFILSLVLFEAVNGQPISNVLVLKINPVFETRHRLRSSLLHKTCKSYIRTIADYKENDSNIEISLSNEENERSNLLLKRLKRVSDQRLAELETLYALNKINTLTSTGRPIYIKINPAMIGRRKRSTRKNLYETRRINRRTSESINDEILIRIVGNDL
ncbi:uncharacterized protein V1478_014243 [Vespula squamosa]|uniref:Uncharacterized protein n=1 Tax=Vespula squamosa TaxID=30214 RepID=A0ABD2A7G4_VESSQ